jgi:hypothetical protein
MPAITQTSTTQAGEKRGRTAKQPAPHPPQNRPRTRTTRTHTQSHTGAHNTHTTYQPPLQPTANRRRHGRPRSLAAACTQTEPTILRARLPHRIKSRSAHHTGAFPRKKLPPTTHPHDNRTIPSNTNPRRQWGNSHPTSSAVPLTPHGINPPEPDDSQTPTA